jgi:vacuolar-type H+-ATPase catalytic subunit A/Vma1
MATKLEVVKSNLYTANPKSKYLALDDDELLRELYSKNKIKDQYDSFQSFKKDYNVDTDLSQTELQKKVTPYNYSTSQKIVESFEPAIQALTFLYPESVKKNIAVAPIENLQGLGTLHLMSG